MPKQIKKGRPYKEKGEGTELISVRINEQILSQLREAAGDRSLSREINNRLARSLDRDRENDRSPPLRAFCFLLSQVVERAGIPDFPHNWHQDPFRFQAAALAFMEVMGAFSPKGQVRRPKAVDDFIRERRQLSKGTALETLEAESIKEMERAWKTPETLARVIADEVLGDFIHGAPSPGEYMKELQSLEAAGFGKLNKDETDYLRGLSSGRHYGIERARQDLLFKPEGKTKQGKKADD
jgi:hypothetical protein